MIIPSSRFENVSRLVIFRTDASLQIGSGHVMRCLTLADILREQNIQCHFFCREHPGNLIGMIEERGFCVSRLPMTEAACSRTSMYDEWLGASWEEDVDACHRLLAEMAPDWLVVDHYSLDMRWEVAVIPGGTRLLVIDDLADRPHQCDLLLDQNLGRKPEDYHDLVPENCQVLVGPNFALLRSEFAKWREYSLVRRQQQTGVKKLLITLGGVDRENITAKVLDSLAGCSLHKEFQVTVIMGPSAPWLDTVEKQARMLPWPCEIAVNVNDMARRMTQADIAIGAAGSTAWERCCLGLPSLMLVLAENQRIIAESLHLAGAGVCLGDTHTSLWMDRLNDHLVNISDDQQALHNITTSAKNITDGRGAQRLYEVMVRK